MNLDQALICLGATQVIWIDDHFSDTPASVTTMLVNDRDTALACGFDFLEEALNQVDEDQETATADIAQALTDLMGREGREGLLAIRDAFLRQREAAGVEPRNEMSVDTVGQTCRMLAIAETDRWGFDGVEQKLRRVREAADGDGHVAYMVDLRDGNDGLRGLEILKLLARMESQATAFILTHETGADKEAEREGILHDELRAEDALAIPLCVISKQRLKGEPDADAEATEARMVEALRVAIKRAGLRRSVHEVLRHARKDIAESTGMAAQSLLLVSPEHLDAHVVDVSYEEGLSELHVIERALTARIAQRLRHLFATKPEVRASSTRLRQLREIPLSLRPASLDDALTDFHKAEVWEDGELLNVGHAPIACGEVFMTDPAEKATAAGKPKMFVLLAQPCDVAIRSDGKRSVETGVLVPLKAVDGTAAKPEGKKPSDKDYRLPVMLDGEILTCHMREAVPVRLSILDLASFRADGRVRVDHGAAPPAEGLLPGLAAAFAARTKAAVDVMAAAAGPDGSEKQAALLAHQEDLQLLLAAPDIFKHVRRGVHEKATSVKERGVTTVTPERVTWRLQRCGRIRMPYAADLLDRYVYTVNRSAFDVDYVARGLKASPPAAAPEVPAPHPAAANGG